MNEIREVANAYFEGGKEEKKQLAIQFFQSLDANNNGVVCLEEYKKYVETSLSSEEVFKLLDKNGDKTLDFDEVKALYYMEKVSIPRCRACHEMLLASYFSCVPCLGKTSYHLCCNCYGGKKFEHNHCSDEFADTRALLKLLDRIMEKAEVRKVCEEDGNNCEKNDADGEPKRSTFRFKFKNDADGEPKRSTSRFKSKNDADGEPKRSTSRFKSKNDADGEPKRSTSQFKFKNDADGEPKQSTSRSKSEIVVETLHSLTAGFCLGGAVVTFAGTIAVSPACCIM